MVMGSLALPMVNPMRVSISKTRKMDLEFSSGIITRDLRGGGGKESKKAMEYYLMIKDSFMGLGRMAKE